MKPARKKHCNFVSVDLDFLACMKLKSTCYNVFRSRFQICIYVKKMNCRNPVVINIAQMFRKF